MPKNYPPLPTLHLQPGTHYIHSGELPEIIHIDDPALAVMLDYETTQAVTIHQHAFLTEATIEMKACHVHTLLVVDSEDHIVGIISSEDLLGEKPVKVSQEKFINRSDLKVRMIMTPQEQIVVLDYDTLRLAKVGHIIQTLKAFKQHYALVVQNHPKTKQQMIRGFYSLSQISKLLAVNIIDDDPLARSLGELRGKIGD